MSHRRHPRRPGPNGAPGPFGPAGAGLPPCEELPALDATAVGVDVLGLAALPPPPLPAPPAMLSLSVLTGIPCTGPEYEADVIEGIPVVGEALRRAETWDRTALACVCDLSARREARRKLEAFGPASVLVSPVADASRTTA